MMDHDQYRVIAATMLDEWPLVERLTIPQALATIDDLATALERTDGDAERVQELWTRAQEEVIDYRKLGAYVLERL